MLGRSASVIIVWVDGSDGAPEQRTGFPEKAAEGYLIAGMLTGLL